MLAQRVAQQSLRRLVVQQPNALRFAAPAAIATGRYANPSQRRLVAAQAISESEARDAILAKQRLNRPVAPHLGIYQPQITWYGSALNRITGCVLSGAFYTYGALYLVAPVFGWHVESAVLAASFASWPVVAQLMAKLPFSFFFTYHCMNGIRHLIWDTGKMITNQKVKSSGWLVVGASAISAVALLFV